MTNIAESLAPQLPYLRRYARSLTGSQSSGDAYVAAVLEMLIADPQCLPDRLGPRVGIYHVFTKIWNSVSSNTEAAPVIATQSVPLVDRRIEKLMPLPRQAFLLVSVEGFTSAEAAAILDKPLRDLQADLDEAGREIAEQVATSVLIIEDEPLIAFDLESIVKGLGHSVLQISRTRREAVAAISQRQPGLILADVQLADGSSGLDAVSDILGDHEVPVIFITAYPEQVLTGLRPEPTFLISKPFNPEMVRAIISQALFFDIRAQLRGKSMAAAPAEGATGRRQSPPPSH